MAFTKYPEGFVHPGYVLVSLYTGKDEPIVNVYGPFPTLVAAKKQRKKDLADFEEREGPLKARDLSVFARPIHDLDQLNRLADEEAERKRAARESAELVDHGGWEDH